MQALVHFVWIIIQVRKKVRGRGKKVRERKGSLENNKGTLEEREGEGEKNILLPNFSTFREI